MAKPNKDFHFAITTRDKLTSHQNRSDGDQPSEAGKSGAMGTVNSFPIAIACPLGKVQCKSAAVPQL